MNETENKNNNNMSEQTQSPYAGRQLTTDKIVHKTLVGESLEVLDELISEALNDGCQPAGPIFQLQNGHFALPTVKVPRSMQQPIRG
jgi:hypothetical protein